MRRTLKITAIVLVALALLLVALLVVGWAVTATTRRMAQTHVSLIQLQMASSNYFLIYGHWPQSIHNLDIHANPSNIWFIVPSPATNDAWDRPIIYEPFDSSRGYGRVLSYGRDGKPGGAGPDEDIEFRFRKSK